MLSVRENFTMPSISENGLKQRRKEGRLCVVNAGKVYDVTDFAAKHPGGLKILQDHAGEDVTRLMQDSNPHKHSKAAYTILKKYYIGDVDSTSAQNGAAKSVSDPYKNDLVDWDKPLMDQVGFLGDKYFDWVHQPVERQIRLFDSAFCEFCSTAPWWLVPIFWIPIMTGFLVLSYQNFSAQTELWPAKIVGGVEFTTMHMPLLFLAGVLLWTFAEYVIHRWVFHMRPPGNYPSLIRLHFCLHGQHHKSPMDKRRLVFPPVPASIIGFCLYTIYASMFPLAMTQVFFAGTIMGYMSYDMTHYYLHHGGPPKLTYFQNLKKYHVKHHFEEQQKGFGISSKLWDYPFGTLIEED